MLFLKNHCLSVVENFRKKNVSVVVNLDDPEAAGETERQKNTAYSILHSTLCLHGDSLHVHKQPKMAA